MNITALSSSAPMSMPNRFKYNGKEEESELGLDWYDYHARQYDAVLGRFTSIDPHAENYYSWNPYNYVGNNPIIRTDPDGMDWYEDKDGNVMWQKGSDDIAGYTNLGDTYTSNLGDGVSVTYTQNEATSITYINATESDWESQISSDGTIGNCYTACSQMVANSGEETAGKLNEVLVANHDENGVVTTANGNQNEGQAIMDITIENGGTLMVGVDYKSKQTDNKSSTGGDGMTDHFVTVVGKTETLSNGTVTGTTYRFYDPRTSHVSKGTHSTNTFSKNSKGLFKGSYYKKSKNYTVTSIRKNK